MKLDINSPFSFTHGPLTFNGSLIEAKEYCYRMGELFFEFNEKHGKWAVEKNFRAESEFVEQMWFKLVRDYPDLW